LRHAWQTVLGYSQREPCGTSDTTRIAAQGVGLSCYTLISTILPVLPKNQVVIVFIGGMTPGYGQTGVNECLRTHCNAKHIGCAAHA
jgi:hypothetical protein